MNKIYDKFEYYDEIDLNKYIEGEESTKENFTLHSVVVHSGGAFSGHYYVYIKPNLNDKKWYLFNDEFVKPAEEAEVFDYQYGGTTKNFKVMFGNVIEQTNICDASAYILVYIKNTEREKILTKVNENDVSLI